MSPTLACAYVCKGLPSHAMRRLLAMMRDVFLRFVCTVKAHAAMSAGNGSQFLRDRPKGVFGKGVGPSAIARMRQKCVRKCVKMGLVLVGKEECSKMRQKCVKNASKMRGAPSGENTFWTIPATMTIDFNTCENTKNFSVAPVRLGWNDSSSSGFRFWRFLWGKRVFSAF